MKTATIPPLRVTPELRHDAESVLEEGETLSNFVESALRKQIEFRRVHKEFVARGLAAREDAKRMGTYYTKEESLAALDDILAQHKPA